MLLPSLAFSNAPSDCSKQTALNIKVTRKGHSLIEFACGQQETLPVTLYVNPPFIFSLTLPEVNYLLDLIGASPSLGQFITQRNTA